MRTHTWLLLAAAGLATAGCRVGQARNPNDPNEVSAEAQPKVIDAYITQMWSDVIRPARDAGQVTSEQGDQLMITGAKEYLDAVHFKETPPTVAWLLAKSFIAAHEWDRAEKLLETAVQTDKGPDRQVHDRIWIARCQAELGQVAEAIKSARSAFDAPPEWKWPILYAVYLEIVPAAERVKPSARIELAHLVEDAIKQHEAASGSLEDERTSAYVATRAHHISEAWNLVVNLYRAANRPDLARAAATKAIAPTPNRTKAFNA
jgi:tetratricopeptide (TPR) repeat protein